VGYNFLKILIPILARELQKDLASTNRMLSLYKEVNRKDCKVIFLFLLPGTEKNRLSKEIEGIKCFYLYESSSRPFIKKNLFVYLQAILDFKKFMKKNNLIQTINFISLPFNHSFLFYFLIKFFKKNGIKLFQEQNEYPEISYQINGLRKIYRWFNYKIYIRSILPRLDFMFVITRNLCVYFAKFTKAKIYHIPMTVDLKRFTKLYQNLFDFPYIAYCGTMNKNKDGVDILVKAFKKITNEIPQHKLVLIGPMTPKRDFQDILSFIEERKITERILFTGQVNSDKIPQYLQHADCLCLARPDSKQAHGGFPSKLGEYLATGKPVVVTKVGEIPSYLQNNVNAYLAEPDSVDSFSEKLREVFSNQKKAAMIGSAGRDIALNDFNAHIQAEKMTDFFKEHLNT